jgi:hypothetical protein
MERNNERRGAGILGSAAILLPLLCCAAVPFLAAAGASAGIALLGVSVILGALLLATGLIGLTLAVRRESYHGCYEGGRLPSSRRRSSSCAGGVAAHDFVCREGLSPARRSG